MIAPQPKCEICVKNTFLHFEFGRLIFEDTPSRTAYSFCVTVWFRWILMIDNYELRWIKLPVRSVCRHFISLSSNNQVSFLRGKCQALQWSIPLTHETHWESKPLICIIFYKGRLFGFIGFSGMAQDLGHFDFLHLDNFECLSLERVESWGTGRFQVHSAEMIELKRSCVVCFRNFLWKSDFDCHPTVASHLV